MGQWVGLGRGHCCLGDPYLRQKPLPLPRSPASHSKPSSSQGLSQEAAPPQCLDPRCSSQGPGCGPGRVRRRAGVGPGGPRIRGTSSRGDPHAPALPAGSPGPLLVGPPAPEHREAHGSVGWTVSLRASLGCPPEAGATAGLERLSPARRGTR